MILNNWEYKKEKGIFSSKLKLKNCDIIAWELWVYANSKIFKNEIIMIQFWKVINNKEFEKLNEQEQRYPLQISDDVFLNTQWDRDLCEYINHSCDANVWIIWLNVMVAMREINQWEELCFDYAMSDTTDFDIWWDCKCWSQLCRKVIYPTDWKIPELQKRYDWYFMDYINEKIINLNKNN